MNKTELIEKLADLEHDSWSRWMKYLFNQSIKRIGGSIEIPPWAVEQWTRKMNTSYKDLSEDEKESDRKEVRKVIELLIHENIIDNQ